jgi:photosystem II stability/assembly factor-like uncharacterized protein
VKLHQRVLHAFLLTAFAAIAVGWAISGAAAEVRWTPAGIQQPGEADRVIWSIDSAPGRASTILVSTFGHGVLRTTDGGSTWTAVLPRIDAWFVRFDADHAGVVYAGTPAAGLYKSVDGGAAWALANQGLADLDVRSIAITKDLLVVGTSRGVFYSTNAAGTWTTLGLSDLSISAVAILPTSAGVTLLAGADNGASAGSSYLFRSQDETASWTSVRLPGDPGVVASLSVGGLPSGATARPVVAGTAVGLFRSTDGASTWTQVGGLPEADINVAVFNPANPDQLYAASDGDVGTGGVFRSLDGGSTWSPLGFGLPTNPRVTALALQPVTPLTVFAATWNPSSQRVGLYHIPDPDATSSAAQATPKPSSATTARPAPTVAVRPNTVPVTTTAGASFAARLAIAAGAVVLVIVALAVVLARQFRPS